MHIVKHSIVSLTQTEMTLYNDFVCWENNTLQSDTAPLTDLEEAGDAPPGQNIFNSMRFGQIEGAAAPAEEILNP